MNWLNGLHITYALALILYEPIDENIEEAQRSGRWKDPGKYNMSRGEDQAAMQMLYDCVLGNLPEVEQYVVEFAREAVHGENVTQEDLEQWYRFAQCMQQLFGPMVKWLYDPAMVDHAQSEHGNLAVYWFYKLCQDEEWRERYASINDKCRVWMEDPDQPWNATG